MSDFKIVNREKVNFLIVQDLMENVRQSVIEEKDSWMADMFYQGWAGVENMNDEDLIKDDGVLSEHVFEEALQQGYIREIEHSFDEEVENLVSAVKGELSMDNLRDDLSGNEHLVESLENNVTDVSVSEAVEILRYIPAEVWSEVDDRLHGYESMRSDISKSLRHHIKTFVTEAIIVAARTRIEEDV